MSFDLILRNARLPDGTATDIGIAGGLIAALAPNLAGEAAEVVDCGGRLVSPGFVETDKPMMKFAGIVNGMKTW